MKKVIIPLLFSIFFCGNLVSAETINILSDATKERINKIKVEAIETGLPFSEVVELGIELGICRQPNSLARANHCVLEMHYILSNKTGEMFLTEEDKKIVRAAEFDDIEGDIARTSIALEDPNAVEYMNDEEKERYRICLSKVEEGGVEALQGYMEEVKEANELVKQQKEEAERAEIRQKQEEFNQYVENILETETEAEARTDEEAEWNRKHLERLELANKLLRKEGNWEYREEIQKDIENEANLDQQYEYSELAFKTVRSAANTLLSLTDPLAWPHPNANSDLEDLYYETTKMYAGAIWDKMFN